MDEDLRLIKSGLTKNRNLRLVFAALAMTGGLAIALYLPGLSRSSFLGIKLIGSFFMLAGCFLFYYALVLYDVNKDELITKIKRNPRDIVWIYYYEVQHMPYGISISHMTTLYFCLRNKDKMSITMGKKQIIQLMDALRHRLDHASFGYSLEKDQLYRANPDLLIQF